MFGRHHFDPDFDYDVDHADFGLLQACLSGPGTPPSDPACTDANLDHDNDVDPDDVSLLRGCLTGAAVPADAGCLD